MKKSKLLNVIIGALLVVSITSTAAFAAVGQTDTLKSDTPQTAEQSKPKEAANLLKNGVVSEVTEKDGTYTILVGNPQDGVVFHSKSGVFVIDQKTGKHATLGDIKKGMTVSVVLGKNTPMTMSLPPQTNGALGFVLNTDSGSLNLSIFNEDLTNSDNTLKLNIGDTTQILSINGEKKIFTAADLKNKECLVLYTVSTRSIPAQTNPSLVMIIGDGQDLVATPKDSISAEDISYVSLREGAEAKGYTVEWLSAKEPITLKKDDITATVTIGSDTFTFTHKTKDIKPLDNVKKLDGIVKLENGKTMVPSTFIEAL